MSTEGLFDHEVTVYRLTETLNEYREEVNSYVLQNDSEKLAIVPPRENRSDLGAGDVSRGIMEGFARVNANIVEEDVLNVTKGPEAPTRLRVLTKSKPRGNHLELTFERFRGDLDA